MSSTGWKLGSPYLDNEIDVHPLKPVNTGFFRVLRAKKRDKKP